MGYGVIFARTVLRKDVAIMKMERLLVAIGTITQITVTTLTKNSRLVKKKRKKEMKNGKKNGTKNGVELMNDGKYDEAIAAFEATNGYKDSSTQKSECYYQKALITEKNGSKTAIAMAYGAAGAYKDAKEKSFALWNKTVERETLSAGYEHTLGLRSDGTVAACGYNDDGRCDVSDWQDIVAVSAGAGHTVGLRSDGTVVATKYTGDREYYYGQCDVSDWTDIVAVSAGDSHTVGLRSDGTVVTCGDNSYGQCDVSGWKNIKVK